MASFGNLSPFDRHNSELDRLRSRVFVGVFLVFIAFAALFTRLFYLQVVKHDYYSTRAQDNRIALVPIVPNRGLITDRNGIVMARNYSAFTLEINPSKVENIEKTINALSEHIDIQARDRRQFQKLLKESKSFESLPIRSRLTDEEVAWFAANRYRFSGVEVNARLFRQYPLGTTASHLLGYINRINKADLETINSSEQSSNYLGTEHIGKTGLEQSYEFELHGKTGYEEIETDAGGNAVRSLSKTAPIQGNNLTLTLDTELQKITEEAFGTHRGALVAIEPSSGAILAMVSVPTFDPNLFVDGIRTDDWNLLNNSPDRPMINRAINGAYPPGSTFKPFMALAALEQGKRTAKQSIADPGYFTFGDHTFLDDKKGGHGIVDMYKSIVHSCNTYYYILANDMGIDNIAKFMGTLGFGARTGVDIEGESEGVLPSPEWKKRRFKQAAQQKWFAGETISIGIGQGYNAYTPIQLAQATATLANNGVMYRPHLVKYVTNSKTGEKRLIEPEPLRDLGLNPEYVDTIKKAMVGVNKEGTGARVFAGASYESGGKTGTAQVFSLKGTTYSAGASKRELRDHALFIAFAPAEKPTIALAMIVENGGFGAQAAAPIARTVLDYYLLGKRPKGAAQLVAAPESDEDHDHENENEGTP